MLRGDEVGALLGWHLIQRGVPQGRGFANSIVSSRLLAAMAADAGVPHEETLTGFKWIARVPGLAYGYEEALGYCVAPDLVRDKDGVSAALLLAELAAGLKAQGRGLTDVLDDLARRHGVYLTDSFSVRVSDLSLIDVVMTRLREAPPERVADLPVSVIDDLAAGDGGLPPPTASASSCPTPRGSSCAPAAPSPAEDLPGGHRAGDRGGPPAARARAGIRLAAIRRDFEALTSVS